MERKERSKDWFKNWANEYDNTLGKVKRHHKLLDLVVASSDVKDNDIVLDIGCGTGLLSLKFLKKANCLIRGIDISPEMLNIFKSKILKLNIQHKVICEQGNADNFSFPDTSFDIIASTVSLHHVKNKLPMIKRIYKHLKPGGKLIIGDIDMDTTGNLKDPERMLRILNYLKNEYALALAEGGIKAFNRMYDNGKKHILNEGEYCISFKQWKELCAASGFRKINIYTLQDFKWFKVITAVK